MTELTRFAEDYYRRWYAALATFDRSPLPAILAALTSVARRSGTLWLAGNGGSAAIADHAACDLTAASQAASWRPGLRCVSLSANASMLSALANDHTFADVFQRQLSAGLDDGDAVLLISSSGNSPNILNAARYAQERGVTTIGLVGFDGGALAHLADHVVWVQAESYGMCEDAHQSVIHVLADYIALHARRR